MMKFSFLINCCHSAFFFDEQLKNSLLNQLFRLKTVLIHTFISNPACKLVRILAKLLANCCQTWLDICENCMLGGFNFSNHDSQRIFSSSLEVHGNFSLISQNTGLCLKTSNVLVEVFECPQLCSFSIISPKAWRLGFGQKSRREVSRISD